MAPVVTVQTMSSIPSIRIPDIPTSPEPPASNTPLTPKTPKSMLKNLFTWRKPAPTGDRESLHVVSRGDPRPSSSASKQPAVAVDRAPSLSGRSRSDTAVPQRAKTRSKSRRRSRSRGRAVWDPPPLFQAYSQAFMHDALSVPSKGLLDWLPRNTTARVNTKLSDAIEDDRPDSEGTSIGHKRSTSNSSTVPNKKLFFLFEDGHILQYKLEGSHDRLPERTIELSRESVAFASDAIAGKHWVLEICPHGRVEDDSRSQPKSPWSRMSLKAPETKRAAEKLLMVFESAEDLFSWLIAIRKQIEGLGGIEYQPDMTNQSQTETERPNLRHTSSEYFKRKSSLLPFSRSSSALPLRPDDDSSHTKDLPQLPAGLCSQKSTSARSTATSSVVTASSLDRLRESYSGSSTAGTALSSDISAASLSPTKESFPAMLSPVMAKESGSHTPIERLSTKTVSSPMNFSEKHVSSLQSSPPPQISHSENIPDALEDTVKNSVEEESRPGSSLISADEKAQAQQVTSSANRPISVLAPLPVPELRKRLREAQRTLSVQNVESLTETKVIVQPSSTERRHLSKPSLNAGAKGSYGLFPKRLALDVKAEPLVVADKNHVPGLLSTQATDHLDISASPITPVAANFGSNLFARSNTSFKRPSPIALPHLLAPIELEQPMRSPAVTDAMLASNFGTSFGASDMTPVTPIETQVPSFNDIRIDKSLFESIRQIEAQTTPPSVSPKSKSIAPRRSMPNFHYSSNDSLSAPIGPPPSGPLPAVPAIPSTDDGRVSRASTLSKRTSTQTSGNRRASTKSASSTRVSRSHLSSLSPQMPPMGRSLSTNAKSSSPTGTRVSTPRSTSPSPQKSQASVTTIGQVSVVAAPPRVSSLPQHKKSQSTSSSKSGRSGKYHLRTPSGRTLHGSLGNLTSITHLITPACGLGLDSDLASRGCFGISASR